MALTKRKWLLTLLKLALTVVAISFVLSKIQPDEIRLVLQKANFLWLVVALAFFVISKILSSFRLNQFLRAIGISLTQTANLQLYWLGMYYNLFLPGGIGGDGYKIYLLNRQFDVKAGKILRAVLLDRISGLAALGVLSLPVLYAIAYRFPYKQWTLVLVPLGLLVYYVLIRYGFKEFISTLLVTTQQSLLVQAAQILSALCILYALGSQGQESEYVLLFLVSSMVSVLPLTIGGIGAREATFVLGAQLLGLNSATAVAVSMLFYLITAFVSLSGVYFDLKPLAIK